MFDVADNITTSGVDGVTTLLAGTTGEIIAFVLAFTFLAYAIAKLRGVL